MPAQNDISNWFTSIPYITRWWFGLSIIVPLMGRFGLLSAYYMVLLFNQLVFQFQVGLYTSIMPYAFMNPLLYTLINAPSFVCRFGGHLRRQCTSPYHQ